MTKTTSLLGILITIIAGIFLYMKLCSSCGVPNVAEEEPAKEVVAQPVAPQPTSYPFALSDGEYAYNVNDNFNFNVSSSTYLEPLSQKVRDGIIPGLKDFLTENENKVLNITGYYKGDENNDSAFPNLGLARANAVKNYMVSQEIPSSQINTMGKLMGDMVPDGNVFLGPVNYSIAEVAANAEDEIKALYDKIEADPLVLYFDTAEASINLSASQKQKVADISRYLDKVEKAKCEVVGYTDSQGRRRTNMRLGQERADFAKAYLIQNGIAEDRIKTDSKGPRDPVASNDTEEGRAKNRRTVISIK
ncbi:cell envelope biogenesis protein OmpA [Aggregatimonas sangjinii]|uniref:Cell envelope biogenesis protein OmpA n=1 Tax=Aggregatimonas sangjinii TaxID=2583587 RepID=A0A5B7SYS9_9FLAO|nr:OmpA family protein [Aggregatimonas sangjinii]QCX02081.1 cell envelope biogenesis protein OmpA [Aggregatimonas sangjinii]